MRRSGHPQLDYDTGDLCRDHQSSGGRDHRDHQGSGGRDHHHQGGMRHHMPLDHFRPSTSLDLYRSSHSSSQGDLHRVNNSMAPSYHVCTSSNEGFRPVSTGGVSGTASAGTFHHSPGCPHTTHPTGSGAGPPSHDPFRGFSGDMCRGLSRDSGHGYSDIERRSIDHHHDPYHRHPSPQEGSRSEMYRDVHPHHHHHHHHHPPASHHQSHQHPHHLVRHTSNIDRHTIERHRANLESRGVLETRHEYDSDDPLERLVEHPTPTHHHFTSKPPEVLRHHRSVPDMYARLQEEERAEQQRQPQSEQHTYGEGCRLRRQQSLSKDTAMSGGSASSDPPPPPSSHRARLAGLHRQHSLGTELSRSQYSHDLFGPPPEPRHQQDMTRSQSSALDLARAGSVGVLGHSTMDIRRSRSNVQDICRSTSSRPASETRELRHAHSTHELPRSHSPRSRSPRHHTPLPDVYPEHPRASSGGSSVPSPPVPSGPPSDPGQDTFPRQHSAHCEMSRVARQQNYYHTTLPQQSNRVSGTIRSGLTAPSLVTHGTQNVSHSSHGTQSVLRGNHVPQNVPHGAQMSQLLHSGSQPLQSSTSHQHLHPAYRGYGTTTVPATSQAQHNPTQEPLRNGRLKVSSHKIICVCLSVCGIVNKIIYSI